MSSELPCVVTDVGDSGVIVGDCGKVVETDSVGALVEGLEEMMQEDYTEFGKYSRQRIIENFSIETMVKKTENEIMKCVG